MTIKKRLDIVNASIEKTAYSCGREPGTIRLVAVAKTFPKDTVIQAIEAGAEIIGENYIQEAREKFDPKLDVSWHFIGHLQANKARPAVEMFNLIHSVDSLKLAKELDKHARSMGKIQDILLQLNISGEGSKSGFSPDQVEDALDEIRDYRNISVKGLMTMPPFFDDPEKARPYFSRLRELGNRFGLKELSMGMTNDYRIAIEEGSTLVRIGTAIFGSRRLP